MELERRGPGFVGVVYGCDGCEERGEDLDSWGDSVVELEVVGDGVG